MAKTLRQERLSHQGVTAVAVATDLRRRGINISDRSYAKAEKSMTVTDSRTINGGTLTGKEVKKSITRVANRVRDNGYQPDEEQTVTATALDDLKAKGVTQKELRDLWADETLTLLEVAQLCNMPLERVKEAARLLGLPEREGSSSRGEAAVLRETTARGRQLKEHDPSQYTAAQRGNPLFLKSGDATRNRVAKVLERHGITRELMIAYYDAYTLREITAGVDGFGSHHDVYIALGLLDIRQKDRTRPSPGSVGPPLPNARPRFPQALSNGTSQQPSRIHREGEKPKMVTITAPAKASTTIYELREETLALGKRQDAIAEERKTLADQLAELDREYAHNKARRERLEAAIIALEALNE